MVETGVKAVGPPIRPWVFPEEKGPSRGGQGHPAAAGVLVQLAGRVAPVRQKVLIRPKGAAGGFGCPDFGWAYVVVVCLGR